MGFFDVPTVERKPWGILGLVLNIIPVPGLGTIIVGAKAGETGQIIKGIIQMVVLFLGWIWAVIDGIRIFMRSTTDAPMAFTESPAPVAAASAPAPAAKAASKPAAKKAPAKKTAAKKAK